MSEERPVPRRESPWGLPEGDTRQPKAHRCNDRAEDVVQAVFEGNPFKTVPGPFKLFWQCMRSKPGVYVNLFSIDVNHQSLWCDCRIVLGLAVPSGGTNGALYLPAVGSSEKGGSQSGTTRIRILNKRA
ncbi:hypothetical protein C2845_PM09G21760 [Panicum miliaceum]|uniref:Uncharacterized protein n=1 Tax=Panicum miliaceum TaxID=4540 RepID=A0A3L6RY08_PANMI|nr:hypothetical protein C2845_PM09G21760 [Panicum miliaceum]